VNEDGRLIAKACYGLMTFQEPLPPDFQKWTDAQQRHHLKTQTVPKLKYLVQKAKGKRILSK